jgi:REP element-mobilizing transposase RayT
MEMPAKCNDCAKLNPSRPHEKCQFCRDLEFKEFTLCELNRCIQDRAVFECHAYQPALKLVGPSSKTRVSRLEKGPTRDRKEFTFREILHSNKIKYEKALALQRLGRDPDGVYGQLNYHFAWNVIRRIPLFNPPEDFIHSAHEIFQGCNERVGGFVHLLHLAPDHLHLYAESDGELSIEEMVQRMKQFSNHAFMNEFPLIKNKLGGDTEIWDEAYFVETVFGGIS